MTGLARLGLLLVAACLAAAPAAARPSRDVPRLTAEESAQLDSIVERGNLLFDLDKAAWVTTDDLAAKVGDIHKTGFKGYVTERDGNGFVVTFYAGEPGSEVATYVGHVAGGRVVSSRLLTGPDRIALTPVQRRLAAARRAGFAAGLRPCTNGPFNVTAVPPISADQPLELYLTSPQVETDVYPFGGHYLLKVGPDGRVLSTRKFTNSCINMSARPSRPGSRPAGLFITHLLDPVPTEVHVFLARTIGLPVYVGTTTSNRVWEVQAKKIRLVSTIADTAPRPSGSD